MLARRGEFYAKLISSAALLLSGLLIYDYWQITLWQPDSAYYDLAFLKARIKYEGRWLMPYLSPLLLYIDGRVWTITSLVLLFGFFYICAFRYTNQASYSLVFGALCIQVPPIAYQLMWPAITVVPLAFLFFIALNAKRIGIWPLYILSGILFFGTASNFYYLLPLLHLGLLKSHNLASNLKTLCLNILPAWASGFIVGYLVMQLAVYLIFGTVGLEIRAWREPHSISNINDVISNTLRAFSYLQTHLVSIFSSFWGCLILIAALLVNYYKRLDQNLCLLVLIGVSMILVHYIITIPVGIKISFRTVIATWIGLFLIVFLNPNLARTQTIALMSLMLAYSALNFRENHTNLAWYAKVSNTLYSDLLEALPRPAPNFKGVMFLSANNTVYQTNLKILKMNDLRFGKIPWLNTDSRWGTAAYKVGFEEVILCGSKDKYRQICIDFPNHYDKIIGYDKSRNTSKLHRVHGTYQDYLVLSLRP